MLTQRPRRLRKNSIIRELIAETRLSKDMFVYPYFVIGGTGQVKPIEAMPGISHFSVDKLVEDVAIGLKMGINKVLLFGVGEEKTVDGNSSYQETTIVSKAVRELKKHFGDSLYVITDVCVCAYTTHGHCGVLHNKYVDNDASIHILSQMALSHAHAGADMVAPSDMMDGRVGAIRTLLDKHGFRIRRSCHMQ
jgi:porphobilinogen synthase